MIDEKDFCKTVSQSFWKHIHNNTFVPVEENAHKNRIMKLKQWCQEINDGHYSPDTPRDYVVSNKHNFTARIVPSLAIKDYCIYFYCIKKLEKYLALNRVEGTYGGFSLGGDFRTKENQEIISYEEIPFSSSPFSYNPLAWIKAWRDFQKKAYIFSRKGDYPYYLKFDIANFYNTINLSLLERKLRLSCPKNTSEVIDLLFYFLRFWNKKFLYFAEQTVGLPQDEVGDCSRLLANFYLQDYDKAIFEMCDSSNSCYMRYSDDQIIMSPNKEVAEKILFDASKELFRIGLNINSSKVDRIESIEAWDYYWCFDLFNELGDPNNKEKLETVIDAYLKLNPKKCRYDSLTTRLLNCNLMMIKSHLRLKVLSKVFDEKYLSNCDARIWMRIYEMLDETEKTDFIGLLKHLSDKVLFNKFHYSLLRAKRMGLPLDFEEYLHEKISNISLNNKR